MSKKLLKSAICARFVAVAALAFASVSQATAIDVIQAPTAYFVPDDALKTSYPYYRWNGEDWSWTHNAYNGTITSAYLLVSAYDVDAAQGEVDQIWVNDGATQVNLGSLAGANDIWNFTLFSLSSDLFDDIASGLKATIKIDTDNDGWAVMLAKSALCINPTDTRQCYGNPTPSVPEPASLALMGLGLAGLVAARRRKAA